MNKILISRTDMLGDVILSFPVVSALRKKYPDSQIWFLARNYTSDILKCNPKINGILTIDDSNNKKKNPISLIKEIKEKKFDIAFILYPSLFIALILFISRIPKRIGSGYRWYSLLFNKRIYEHRKYCTKHEVEYNLELLRPFGIYDQDVTFDIEIPNNEKNKIEYILKNKGITENDLLIIIHPSSKGSAIDWNPKNFVKLIDIILSKTNSKIIISGTKSEEHTLNKIMNYCIKKPIRLESELTLKEFSALLKRADLLISNSTGPLHLAVVLGVDVIGIYPDIIPLNPTRWGPYKREDSILTPKIPEGVKKSKKNYIKFKLMDLITPEEVFNLVEKKIAKVRHRLKQDIH
jgi:ADP-heptose:LPS heptosyltransferase